MPYNTAYNMCCRTMGLLGAYGDGSWSLRDIYIQWLYGTYTSVLLCIRKTYLSFHLNKVWSSTDSSIKVWLCTQTWYSSLHFTYYIDTLYTSSMNSMDCFNIIVIWYEKLSKCSLFHLFSLKKSFNEILFLDLFFKFSSWI